MTGRLGQSFNDNLIFVFKKGFKVNNLLSQGSFRGWFEEWGSMAKNFPKKIQRK
jgi:hypothetical protein